MCRQTPAPKLSVSGTGPAGSRCTTRAADVGAPASMCCWPTSSARAGTPAASGVAIAMIGATTFPCGSFTASKMVPSTLLPSSRRICATVPSALAMRRTTAWTADSAARTAACSDRQRADSRSAAARQIDPASDTSAEASRVTSSCARRMAAPIAPATRRTPAHSASTARATRSRTAAASRENAPSTRWRAASRMLRTVASTDEAALPIALTTLRLAALTRSQRLAGPLCPPSRSASSAWALAWAFAAAIVCAASARTWPDSAWIAVWCSPTIVAR